MSEKIKYQFSAVPVEWLISPKLSANEKIVLAVLIALGNGAGQSAVGYEKLAGYCCLSRTYLIELINKLEINGYIERTIQNNRRKPTLCRVCLERVGGHVQAAAQESVRADSCAEKQESDLTETGVGFDTNKSQFEPTLNIFKQDLNYNKGGSQFEPTLNKSNDNNYIATAGVAAVRSMPTGEQVAGNTRQEIEFDADKAAKIQAIKSYFGDKMAFVDVLEISNKIGFRICCKDFCGIDIDAAKGFAALHNIFMTFNHYANERKIAC